MLPRVALLAVSVGLAAGAVALSAAAPAPSRSDAATVRWRSSTPVGTHTAGALRNGVHLPAQGRTFFTWDPVRRRAPNRSWRRWGSDRLVRTLLAVLDDVAAANPGAPRVGVGDLSRPRGGDFGPRFGGIGHVSHQNGLDVDVYYPRRDRRERAPTRPAQIDRRLSQALVDRFVAAGALRIFVGPNTGLRGRRGVVDVLPAHHDNHMHVRLPLARCPSTFVNPVRGHRLRLPCGWHARVSRESGLTEIGSAPLHGPLDRADFRPPANGARLWLFDYGLPVDRARAGLQRVGAVRLGAPIPFEGFGTVRTARFRVAQHAFQAWVKLGRRAPARMRTRVEVLLRSVRLTSSGRRLGLSITSRVAGHTARGRPVHVWRVGSPNAHRRVLVVGCIHGDECAGMAVTQRLVNSVIPLTGEIWVVQNLNPDGLARRSRLNGRGVDLNRNFGAGWRRTGRSGPRPFSEPETRVARDLARRARPAVTIWFHQAQDVVRAWGRSRAAARRYARAVGLPYRSLPWVSGSAPHWQNRRLGQVSFVVELPAGPLSAAAADRHARTILRLVR